MKSESCLNAKGNREYKVILTTIKETSVCIQKYQVFLEYTRLQCEKMSHFCLLRI